MAQGAHAAIASMRDLQRELKDAGLQGYESDTEFNAGFVEEPFKKVRGGLLLQPPPRQHAAPSTRWRRARPLARVQELDAVLVVENLPRVPADKLSKCVRAGDLARARARPAARRFPRRCASTLRPACARAPIPQADRLRDEDFFVGGERGRAGGRGRGGVCGGGDDAAVGVGGHDRGFCAD